MLKAFYKLFPIWFVAWLARRHCERVNVLGSTWAQAFDDVLVKIKQEKGAR